MQFVSTLRGPLNVEAFHHAWDRVQARHECLRSSFVWEKVKKPLQVVHRSAPLPFSVELAGTSGWLHDFLENQRRRGLRLQNAPLFSLTLGRVAFDVHYCIWCYHHLLLDGWSSAVVLREVFCEYRALVEGRPSELEAPVPYSRYLEWLRRQDAAVCERFWRTELAGYRITAPPYIRGTPLPATERLRLSEDLQWRLTAFLRAHRLTTGTVVHGLWALLLARRTASAEVVFGSVVSGRPASLPGADAIVGPMINLLPVRFRQPGETLITAWLQELQSRLLEMQKYGAVSIDEITSSTNASPGARLFHSILTVENYPDGIWQQMFAGKDSLSICDVRFVESTGYPLCLEAVPSDRLVFQLLYDKNRFQPEAICGLLQQLQSLLEEMIANSGAPLSLLLRSRAEATTRQPPAADTLTDLWSNAAARHASNVAVECGDDSTTYRELDEKATRVATRLRQLGVKPDDFVILFFDRSIQMVAGILGVLKAGAAYVPIEPTNPPERLAFLLGDAKATVALTVRSLAPRLGGFPGTLVSLDEDAENAMAPLTGELPLIHPDQAAYVIYTSGSSGRPKGVIVTHRNVVRLFRATQSWFDFGPNDAWTLFHSYAFDFSVWELFGALLNGGRLVIIPYWMSRSPDDFRRLLCDRKITVLNQTPSAFRMLIAQESQEPTVDMSLRLVILGGEELPFSSLSQWFRHHQQSPRLINMYGITETTVHVTYRPVDALDADLVSTNCIGRPIPDLDLHLLDINGESVPNGEVGEICVGGPGLARGYLGDPILTAQRFVPNPFAVVEGERLYRSGDTRPAPAGRRPRVSGPDRPAGEKPRFSHRTGRDRMRSERSPCSGRCCGHPAAAA